MTTNKCEDSKKNSVLSFSVKKAIAKLGYKESDLVQGFVNITVEMIVDEFDYLTTEVLNEAIKIGSSGKYGVVYKMSSQQVGFWIHEYMKETYPKDYRRQKLSNGLYIDANGVKRNQDGIALISDSKELDY